MRILLINVPHPAIGSRIPDDHLPPLGLLCVGGEETGRRLIRALETGVSLDDVRGLAFHRDGEPFATPAATVIANLDDYRVGWELIDHARYSYWGGKRAVVIQFSRGCPHLCTYCGQRGFWTRWRHRDPVRLAKEIAWLHREKGVEVFNFADENPSTGRKAWKAFLEALIAEQVDVTLVGSTRADDIVRDAEFLHLYKQAGFERFLMGTEDVDEATLKLVRKGGATSADREAIRLLRKHNILSMATWVAGFVDQTDRDMLHALRRLIAYDPDQIQALYVTPHRWTPYYREAEDREVVQTDRAKWDYKHQVLGMRKMPPWRLLLWVKLIEVVMQTRPRALRRLLWNPEPKIRHAIRWYYRMGRRVWFHEIFGFFLRDNAHRSGLSVAAMLGVRQDQEEEAMVA